MAAHRHRQRGAGLVALATLAASAWAGPHLLGFVAPGPRTGALRASERQSVGLRAVGDVVEDVNRVLTAKPRQAAKEKLLDLLSDSGLAQEVLRPEGKPIRGRVDEAIIQLERLNPEEEPVYSGKLDGTWNVKYSGSYAPGLLSSPTRELALFLYGGGFSLGSALSSFADGFWGKTLGVKLGAKSVRISGGRDVDATAEVEFLGRKDKLSYTAELMPLSPMRMSEEVVAFKLPESLGSSSNNLPLELRRGILVTYLDEDLMVVRDESGVPEVLLRELSEVRSAAGVAWEGDEATPPSSPPAAAGTAAAKADSADPAWSSEAS